jgi:small-conductance mechanosensitive channel
MPPEVISPSVPDGLGHVLLLAGLIVCSVTVAAAIVSTLFVQRESLFYLGTQLILLSLFIHLSVHWAYPLWFARIFDSPAGLVAAAETMLALSAAFTIDVGLRIWLWNGMLRRHGERSVPPLLIGTTRVFLYLTVSLAILQFVYSQPITALATLSGAFALVLGLSAQSTLGEMFAGIAIALSRPVHIGDWVKIGNNDEGRVTEMSWRMVRVRTRDGIMLNVPNRAAADQVIQNFTHPSRQIRLVHAIFFPDEIDPALVQEVLTAAMIDAAGTLAHPAPYAFYRGTRDGVAEYSMRYFIDDYGDKDVVTEAVWKNVVDYVARSPVRMAYPRQFVTLDAAPVGVDKILAGGNG